eukprot:gene22167-biopygen10228
MEIWKRWEKSENPHNPPARPARPGLAQTVGPGWPGRGCGAAPKLWRRATAWVPRGGAEGAAFGSEGATIGAEGAEMPTKCQEMSRTRAMCACVPLQPGLDTTLVLNLTTTP